MTRLTSGGIILQARMGFSDPEVMREGLLAVRDCGVPTVGTITLDSFTRTNQHDQAARAVAEGRSLNGFPIVAYGAERTRRLLDGIAGDSFYVQVRHGSAHPIPIIKAMLDAGLSMTEGGPVSYCLPYGRVPLRESVTQWRRAVSLLAGSRGDAGPAHVESFGGCMLGQLCPPDLLIAIGLLEAMFFRELGLKEMSLSYAQQTHPGQDLEALAALRSLATDLLDDVDWHVVVYTYMGLYPTSQAGADAVLQESAHLTAAAGCERLVVKTEAEASRIPTIAENVRAVRLAANATADTARLSAPTETGIHERAAALVNAVLRTAPTVGEALLIAFASGVLDVPWCLHPANANRSRSGLDEHGRLVWTDTGGMPIAASIDPRAAEPVTSARLMAMLAYVRRRFDGSPAGMGPQRTRADSPNADHVRMK